MTAVEWLVANLFVYGMPDQRCIELVKKAKEMEKQQIIEAYDQMRCVGNFENGEQYYNEEYGK